MPLINKRWDGNQFRTGATFRRWTGSAWKSGATVRTWNGSDWVPGLNMVATGGIVTEVGNWVIHTFLTSGTFNVTTKGEVEYLIIGGGGGGSSGYGGGGGSGGVIMSTSPLQVGKGSYNIIVGAGGSGTRHTSNARVGMAYNVGSDGQPSSAFGLLALGGGRGGHVGDSEAGRPAFHAGHGGGGGGCSREGAAAAALHGNGNQAYKGGSNIERADFGWSGGPGGGAGSAPAPVNGSDVRGGAGIVSYISGYYKEYAGGGAGSKNNPTIHGRYYGGGSAIGDATSMDYAPHPMSGEDGTGGGGAGRMYTGYGSGAGGSGVVIIRYKKKI